MNTQLSPVPSQPHTSAVVDRLNAQQAAHQRWQDAMAAFDASKRAADLQVANALLVEYQQALYGGAK